MSVRITATYQGELRCAATHGPSGRLIETEAPVDNGGRGESFSPTDLVATALGSCMLTIMGIVAARHDLDLRGTEVTVDKEMAQQPVRRIKSLKTIIKVRSATPLTEDHRQRLKAAAAACPVHQSIHPDIQADIEFTFG